jgi:hypothetical protein
MYRAGNRAFVAADISVEHELSLLDYTTLSSDRFRNFLEAESAYFDMYGGLSENAVLTATLLFRLIKHTAKGTNPALTQEIARVLGRRTLHSKTRRVAEWRQSAQMRTVGCAGAQLAPPRHPIRPRVSVCLAAYNGARLIEAQLRSILGQLHADDEVVVVDDASSDGTCGVIEGLNDSRIRLMRRTSNQGVLRTFEDAIQMATGEILFLSDQDDLWTADKVSTVLAAFRSAPEADIVVSDATLIDGEGALIGPSYYASLHKFKPGILSNLLHCRYLGCTMAIRTRIRSRVLPFPRGADVLHDLWIGTSNAIFGGKTIFIERPLVQYRRHEGNVTGNKRLSLERRIRIRWDLCRSLAAAWLSRHDAIEQ